MSVGKTLGLRGNCFARQVGYFRGRLILDRVGIRSVVLLLVGRC
jgi:hypothetical protein